jgi:hypothetical protein
MIINATAVFRTDKLRVVADAATSICSNRFPQWRRSNEPAPMLRNEMQKRNAAHGAENRDLKQPVGEMVVLSAVLRKLKVNDELVARR